MPPPSLSTTTTTRSTRAAGAAPSRPLESWRKAMSPTSRRGGPARSPSGHARPRSTPRRRCRWRRGWRAPRTPAAGARTTRGRGPASTTTPRARRRSGSAATSARATPGSVGPGSASSTASMAAWAASPELLPARRASARRPGLQARSTVGRPRRSTSVAGVDGRTTSAVPCGSTQRPRAGGDDLVRAAAPRATRPPPSTPAARRGARRPPGAARRSHVVRRSASTAGITAPGMPHTGGLRGGEDGQPSGAGHVGDGSARARSPRPATITPRRPARSSTRLTSGRPRRAVGGRHAQAPSRPARPAAGGRAVPSSGSRKARFRCTGPGAGPVASASARAASGPPRGCGRRRRPRPGSWNQRTARPKRWVWSMACGAPTSCSSGGRSAVQTSSGTPRQVGLDDRGVQLGGRRAARGEHDRRLAGAERRGRGRGTRRCARRGGRARSMPAWSASASASGVDREPGATTACAHARRAPTRRRAWRRTWPGGPRVGAPSRAHPSTRRLPGSTPWPCTPSAAGRARALVLVHGFTQTGRCWGPRGRRAGRRPRGGAASTRPATGGRPTVARRPRRGRRPARRRGRRRRPTSATRWAPASACTSRSATPSVVRGLVLLGGTAGIEDAAERARSPRAGPRAPPHRLEDEGSRRSSTSWLAQPLFAGLPPSVPFRAERLENTVDGPARRACGWPAPAPRSRSWDRLAGSRCRCSCVAGRRRRKFAALGRAAGRRRSAPTPRSPSSPAPATPPTSSNPTRFLAVVRPWLAATASERLRRRARGRRRGGRR